MANVKGYVVMAGDAVYAGIGNEPGDISCVRNAIVVEFENAEDMRRVFREKVLDLTLFEQAARPTEGD